MFSKHVIRLGDPTAHGGVVVSAAGHFRMFGKPVARLGDKVACPVPGHGVCTIVEGDPHWSIDGIPVALEGHKTSCGASLISTLPNVTRAYEGMGAASTGVGASAAAASAAATGLEPAPRADSDQAEGFDQHFLLTDEVTSEPLANRFYRMTWNGRTIKGYTNDAGLTERVAADAAVTVQIEVFPEGYTGTAA